MESIQIIGAGGIGCAVGANLIRAGCSVTLIDRKVSKIDHGNREGIGVDGKFLKPLRFLHFDDWQPKPGDIFLLCTKCYDNQEVLNRLPDDSILIPIQNGFDPQLAAKNHAWEGIASFVSECESDRPRTRIT